MPMWTGYFNSAGSPVVKLSLCGPFEQFRKEFEAIIDTGFSGFISMPLLDAFPLGLILRGATSLVLADGSVHPTLTALGEVGVGQELQIGLIILEPGSTSILVGMELLSAFHKRLIVSPETGSVLLEDELPQAAAPPQTPAP